MTDPLPAGTDAIVDDAMDEAAQSLFAAAHVPLARTPELLAAIQGRAVRAVLEARIEQIVKHGHDREHDAMLSIVRLPDLAIEVARIARSRIGVTGTDRNLVAARRGLARAAAICLAAIDRLDMINGDEDAGVGKA